MLDVDELKVKLKRTDGTGELLAIVTIEDETISLRGFMVMRSKYEHPRCGDFLRVLPPMYGTNKKKMVVYFHNKEIWYKIEDKILAAYQDKETGPDTSFTEEDEQWINDELKE